MQRAKWDDDIYPQEEDPYFENSSTVSTQDSSNSMSKNGFILGERLRAFILDFCSAIKNADLDRINHDYTIQFPTLTSEYFKNQKWPTAEAIADLVDNDKFFLIIYRELYYRHIHAHYPNGPTIVERMHSYDNYCAFFAYILERDTPLKLGLPNQMLWDIIDEFIYQFQVFAVFRARLKQRSDNDITILQQYSKLWSVHSVINMLHSMVVKSNINEQLREFADAGDPNRVSGEFGKHSIYKMLGFFSLIGLCRLHCHLGDYYEALNTLKHIDITRQDMYHSVQSCHITTGYYAGFSYMMMRRYQEAIRTLSGVLSYHQRLKSSLQSAMSPDKLEYVNKMTDQMYYLLCICRTLYPMHVEEVVQQVLQEKCTDRILRLMKIELKEFESTFISACPKFISPVEPNYEDRQNNYHMAPHQHQVDVFLQEIEEQILVPNLRSFLKLYTSLPISKLASFKNQNQHEVHKELMCFKHKMQYMSSSPSAASSSGSNDIGIGAAANNNNNVEASREAELITGSDIDFFVDRDMIHIADTKVEPNYADFLMKQMHKLKEVDHSLDKLNDLLAKLRSKSDSNPMVAGGPGGGRKGFAGSSYAGALNRK